MALACAAALAPPALADSSPAPMDAIAQLNQWRARVGVGPVAYDAANTEGCRLHAQYYAANHTIGHTEDPSRPGYTPAGAQAADSSVLAYGPTAPGPYAWEWAIYHRIALLNPKLAASGYWSEFGISCLGIFDIDPALVVPAVTAYPYPADGQQDVPPSSPCNEDPNPCESVRGNNGATPIGQPLSVQFNGPGALPAATVSSAVVIPDGLPAEPISVEDAHSGHAGYLQGGVAILPRLRSSPARGTASASAVRSARRRSIAAGAFARPAAGRPPSRPSGSSIRRARSSSRARPARR